MTAPHSWRAYEIHEVSQLTGLDAARIRVWERRYEVVRPLRQANRYRSYTGEQVALLRAYARLCAAGERIGDLAREPRERVIARAEGRATDSSPLSHLVDSIKRLDRDRLRSLLEEHRQRLGGERFGREIIIPLAEIIGDLWALERLSVAAEHVASEVVIELLKLDLSGGPTTGALLLGACLPEEHHEWGILVTLSGLQSAGWRVRYVGANLPLTDLADAAWTLSPQVVALSGSDPAAVILRLPELRRFVHLLPPATTVVLGGHGAEANESRLKRAGLRVGLAMMPEPRTRAR
jgi:DNA-binding transcriptional MerR regulator/methylmalonyl-CoA mutase cobalamin-binding subunit